MSTMPVGMGAAELGALATAEVLDRADLVLQFIDAVRAHGHDLASRGIHGLDPQAQARDAHLGRPEHPRVGASAPPSELR